MKRKIYFHIGFGKTGSSSLQSFLSFNPELKTSGHREKILYCRFNQDGEISYGKELSNMASSSILKYASSSPSVARTADLSKSRSALDKILSSGYIPLFSQEDWGRRSSEFKDSNFFSKLGCNVHLIAYVRPQVDWFNSAWWQWYVWKSEFSTPYDVVAAEGYGNMFWADQITKWKEVPGVETVTVRLQTRDIIADFMSIFGTQKNPEIINLENINVGLSPTLIKLLSRFPEIRGPFNPDVDAILSKHLKFAGKSPWVLDMDLVVKIIDATHADNLKLMGMLDERSRILMKNDRRWWDPDYYDSRPVFSKADMELDKQELLAIIDQAIPALRKIQSINGQRWWDPDYYASRPLYSKTIMELEKQELLAIVDHVIPALIRAESDINEAERDKQIALVQDRVPESPGWENNRLVRLIHLGFVDIPYHFVRGMMIKIWRASPVSIENKQLVKHKLFNNLPWMFSWSKAYRRWYAVNAPSAMNQELSAGKKVASADSRTEMGE